MKLGLFSVVFIVLLILKLCALVTISWWWVFSPLIFVALFWCVLLPMIIIGLALYKTVTERKK